MTTLSSGANDRFSGRRVLLNKFGPLIGLAFVWLLFAALRWHSFVTVPNTRIMLLQTTIVGVAALGATLVIVSGGIDLSVGSFIALGTVTTALFLRFGESRGWLGDGSPFTPKQNSLISILTLSIPALALALWARPGPVPRESLTRHLLHFIVPGAITCAAAGLVVYIYFIIATGDISYAQSVLTYTMILIGILLLIFVEPPTRAWVSGDALSGDWRPTILAIFLFAILYSPFAINIQKEKTLLYRFFYNGIWLFFY